MTRKLYAHPCSSTLIKPEIEIFLFLYYSLDKKVLYLIMVCIMYTVWLSFVVIGVIFMKIRMIFKWRGCFNWLVFLGMMCDSHDMIQPYDIHGSITHKDRTPPHANVNSLWFDVYLIGFETCIVITTTCVCQFSFIWCIWMWFWNVQCYYRCNRCHTHGVIILSVIVSID